MLRRLRHDLALLQPAARSYLFGSALMGGAQVISFTFLARYLNLLGHSKSQIGAVQALDAWGKMLIALPAAFVLSRRSAREVFVGSSLLGGAALCLLPVLGRIGGLPLIGAAAFVVGLSTAIYTIGIAPFLYRHTSAVERATAFGLAEAVGTAASVLGAGCAGLLIAALSKPLASEARATAVVLQLAGVLVLCASFAFRRIVDPVTLGGGTERAWPLVLEHRKVLAKFALPQLLVATGAGFCIPFLATYFQERFGLAPTGWGGVFALGQVLMTLGFMVTPALVARFGCVRSMVGIELMSLPFFITLAFTTSLPLACFAFLMRGALMNTTQPIHKNLMMQATPAGARVVQTGVNAAIWGFGWIVGPLAAGWALDATGNDYRVLMCTTVALYALAAGLTWIFLRPVEDNLSATPE
ncbi:MAG: MFS transporter [Planctomycetota bacterium]